MVCELVVRQVARTLDLAREADERRADVALFVELLSILNLSQTRAELLAAARQRGARSDDPVEVFATLRAWRDEF